MFRVAIVLYLSTTCVLARISSPIKNDVTSEEIPITTDAPKEENMTEILLNAMKSNSSSIVEMMKELEQSVDNDPDDNKMSRRFLKWFKTVVYSNTSSKSHRISTPPTPYDDSLLLQKYLIAVLQNLTRVMDRLERTIDMQNNLSPIRVLPLAKEDDGDDQPKRKKREVDRSHEVQNGSNAIDVTEEAHHSTLSTSTALPLSDADEKLDEKFPCSFKEQNATRRMYQETNPEVKSKLLGYINDTFTEIEAKINPVQEVKKTYTNNSLFRIGYIVANIDTLQVNMQNLRHDMEKHRSEYDDKKILDLFDKIKICNKVVTNLIDSLNGAHENSV